MSLFLLFCTILYSTIGHCARPTLSSDPNIVFIVVDDLPYTSVWANTDGKYDLAPEGNSLDGKTITYLSIPTPNINALMDESVLIPRTYSGGSQCAPSRFAILTGRQPVRSGYAEDWTVENENYDATLGTFVAVPFTKIDTDDENAYNLAAILSTHSDTSYRTGMFGKWHLTSDLKDNLGCTALNSAPDPTLYDECLAYVKAAGFDDVDAFYFGNIEENEYFSHNPEWKIAEARTFITRAKNMGNNFFVYIALTLAHDETDAYAALEDTDGYWETPKGTLSASEDPSSRSGMRTRDLVLTQVDKVIDAQSITALDDQKTVASVMWVDEAIGALITHLKAPAIDLYDDTLFVFVNDHGMGAKGTLYEQGTRQLQVIRFPPYWSLTSAYIAPDDFITSTVDLAAVVYDILGITDDVIENFDIDGTSWIDDLFEKMEDETSTSSCCAERYADAYNSHAIMTDDDLTYIYSPGDFGLGTTARFYLYNEDEEQLYDMSEDPNQQTNVIDDSVYATRVEELRILMDAYIENKACPDGYECVMPGTSYERSMAKSSYLIHDSNNDDLFLQVVYCVSVVCIALMLYCIYRVKKEKVIAKNDENTPLLIEYPI